MKRILVLPLVTAIMLGCGGSKKVAQAPITPSWVQGRPTQAGYYIGIGSARKTTPDYQQAAKQSALADLASDISVSISSQSVLNAFESQTTFPKISGHQLGPKPKRNLKVTRWLIAGKTKTPTGFTIAYRRTTTGGWLRRKRLLLQPNRSTSTLRPLQPLRVTIPELHC